MNLQRMRESHYKSKQRAYRRQEAKKRQFRNTLNLVRFSNRVGNHMNCIRISTGESLQHIYTKVLVCHSLLKQNHKFLTEAIFENGSRCDVLDITEGVVYEILHSETEKQFKKKLENYPEELEIIKVRC